jgi:hypothetical protein
VKRSSLLTVTTFLAIFLAMSLVLSPMLQAHVGSPDVFYEGMAGPYRLFITIRTPQMIPGIAQIEVRSLDGTVSEIEITPLRVIGEGSQNAPPPDRMVAAKDDPQFYTGKLWLMESGSWQVRITIKGAQGPAQMAVPVAAFAQRTLRMQKQTGLLLLGLMTFLVLSLISIFGAAARESQAEPGEQLTPGRRRRALIVMAATGLALVAILFLGNLWWDSVAEANASGKLYKSPPLSASLTADDRLLLQMGESPWHQRRAQMQLVKLIPDHGHLMHLFLLRMPEMDRFYHLHPERIEDNEFAQSMDGEAAGTYAVFADVVRESGFPDTMTTQLMLPKIPNGASKIAPDADDAGSAAPPLSSAQASNVAQLDDGGKIELTLGGGSAAATTTLQSGKSELLRFRVVDRDGKAARDLQPYMGMAGHLIIVKRDLIVFAHIHPAGSMPMAALMLVGNSGDGGAAASDSAGSMIMMPAAGMQHDAAMGPEISFPYGFPQPGDYRLFLQIKRGGKVQTAVFDVHVS